MANNNITNTEANVKVNGTSKADHIYNSAHHVTVTAGKGNDTVEFASGSSRSVYRYAKGDGNDTIIGYDNFTEGVIQLTSGTISKYSIDSKTGDHVIKTGAGSITLKNVKTDKVAIKTKSKNYRYIDGRAFNDPSYNGDNFYTDKPVNGTTGDDYINVGGDKVTINAGVGDDYINIDNENASKNFLINAGAGNDTIKNVGSYSTLVGGTGDDVIYANGLGEVIKYFEGDGNDIIYGGNSYDTIQIVNSNYTTTTSGQDVVINVGDGKITLKNFKGEKLNIKTTTITAADLENVTLTNKDNKVYTAEANVGNIDASKRKKAIKIIGNSNANSITGGTKADTLIGGSGNDTLTGGKGKDVFVHSSGDDVITDYKVGQDKIKFDGTDITGYSIIGSDVRLATKNGSITVKDLKGKRINFLNSKNKTSAQIFGSDSITGSKGKEIIYGSDGKDTIRGGKGNDTLIGNDGADVFVYTAGDGNDVIVDFSSEDKIQLGSKKTKVNIDKSGVSDKDYVLAIGKNKIKLLGAANTSITVVDYDGNSQIYNAQKAYAELFTDDNFASTELDPILEPNSDITNFNEKGYDEKIFDGRADDSVFTSSHSIRNATRQINHVSDN